VDAKALLEVGPAEYVAHRNELVKQATAAKDRATATSLKQLRRPTVALWAVLSAAARAPDAVRDAVESTARLAKVQSHSREAGAIREATNERRRSLDAVVDEALGALREHEGKSAQGRRDEIRDIVERLSRQADLLPAWLDATLRDLPEESFGFGELAMDDGTPSPSPEKSNRSSSESAPSPADERRKAKLEQATAAVDEARREVALARKAVEAADKELASAERQLEQLRRERADRATKLAQAERGLEKAEARRRSAQAT